MASTLAELREELEGIAVIFELEENENKAAELANVGFNPDSGRLTYCTTLAQAKLKLTMGTSPRNIRERAALLEKQARAVSRLGKGKPDGLRAKPSLCRTRYSESIYQKFIDDGEPENAESYLQLFEPE